MQSLRKYKIQIEIEIRIEIEIYYVLEFVEFYLINNFNNLIFKKREKKGASLR